MPPFGHKSALVSSSVATLRPYIDWTPFFHTWELKGVYPRIFEHEKFGEQAKQVFADGNALLDTIVAQKLLRARGVYGLFPANAVGDDVEVFTDEARGHVQARFHFLRQQSTPQKGEPHRSLADFIAQRLQLIMAQVLGGDVDEVPLAGVPVPPPMHL